MVFLPFLYCKTCPGHIWLPLPIQSQNTPRQILWPWGTFSGNFLCPSCMRPSPHWAEDCRWSRAESTSQHQRPTAQAVHRISIPCGVGRCPCLVHILTAMPLGSEVEDAASLVARVSLSGILCDNGHPAHRLTTHGAIQCSAISVTAQGDPLTWATDD
jgi:hypothetical protein